MLLAVEVRALVAASCRMPGSEKTSKRGGGSPRLCRGHERGGKKGGGGVEWVCLRVYLPAALVMPSFSPRTNYTHALPSRRHRHHHLPLHILHHHLHCSVIATASVGVGARVGAWVTATVTIKDLLTPIAAPQQVERPRTMAEMIGTPIMVLMMKETTTLDFRAWRQGGQRKQGVV